MVTRAKKSTAKSSASASRSKKVAADLTGSDPSHEEIAKLAYTLWLDRGKQDGMAERDWNTAEANLRQSHRSR